MRDPGGSALIFGVMDDSPMGPGSALHHFVLQCIRDDNRKAVIIFSAPARDDNEASFADDLSMPYYVYIMASQKNGTLYVGVTNDIAVRILAHREGRGSAFTSRYGVTRLVYHERFDNVNEAIAWEKRVKRWRRSWKIGLIEGINPSWDDFYLTLNR